MVKRFDKLILVFIVLLGFVLESFGQVIDFTNLTGPSVTCYYGSFNDPFANVGIQNDRHTVISTQNMDHNTDDLLPMLPNGESRVIRLGNDQVGAQAEAIQYNFTVDYFKSILLLKFAVVFEDPQHSPSEQPRFVVRVLNKSGHLVEDCAEYDVTAAGSIPGFNSYGIVRWRPWTNVGIDLSSYIGQEVQVQFVTYDCRQGGHYGYAYFTASCIENHLSIVSCDDRNIVLTAPDDFESYLWSSGESQQTCEYYVSGDSMDASCLITSATGCQFTLHAHITVEEGLPVEDEIIYDTICIGDPYLDHYFDIVPQNALGDFIFINTLFDLNQCTGDVDLVLLLHVTDELPQFTQEIEGPQHVHPATNLHTGEYSYRIEKIHRVTNYIWTLSNPKWLCIPDKNECTVFATTPETAVLTVEAGNSCGGDSRSIVINAKFFDMEEALEEDVIQIYPNPVATQMTITGCDIRKVTLYNVAGQKVKEMNGGGKDALNCDVNTLDNGLYFVCIEYGNAKAQMRITVLK